MKFLEFHLTAFFQSAPQKPLDLALRDYFRSHKSLGASDRRWLGEAVYGITRWKRTIDFLCPSPSIADRLICYQSLNFKALREDSSIPEAVRLGISDFLYERLSFAFGKETAQALSLLFQERSTTTLRANLLKTTREKLLLQLSDRCPISPCLFAPAGLRIGKQMPLFSFPEFKEGLFEVQDEGSQLVADLVRATPGEWVLDYCSGSGGKALAFAPSMERKGQIYLHDIRPFALTEARRRLRRAGVQNGQCLPPGHPQLNRLKNRCDWVLADVPCSGTGALRRNPDQKWKIDAPMVSRLVQEQRNIGKEAFSYVKPGGALVYATCSLLPEENEEQVSFFLSALPTTLEKQLVLLPQSGGMDGFFVAVFRKKGLC